jgi:transcriptional regulator with XRE-family HTH domain
MLRCYTSRVENGHTVPSRETLEKFARALAVPLFRFFYEGKNSPALPPPLKRKAADEAGWGETRQEVRDWERFHHLLARMPAETHLPENLDDSLSKWCSSSSNSALRLRRNLKPLVCGSHVCANFSS